MEFSGILITIWLIFIQLFLLLQINSASTRLVGNEVDRISLLAFKAEINDTLGILSSWNESIHLCEWPGITCSRRHQRVTVLDLQSSGLKGCMSPCIGNLSFLRTLILTSNSFKHTIPQEIGRLSRLQELTLENNSFSGDIPFNISHCSNLQTLRLFANDLSGKLPVEIRSLSKLQVLDLGSNNLVGGIPTSFGNLSSLETLYVDHNNLHGCIPNSLGQLKNLKSLVLEENNLSGTIPPSIYNLSSIKVMYVAMNQLHGTLPPGLGHTIFPNLENFVIFLNQFGGPIPISISNASHLSNFQISSNKFAGKVPSLARLSNMFWLSLDENNLGNNKEGDLDFLSSLVNCTNLKMLSINDNNFGGVLPESISNLSTKLWYMASGRNQIRGSIPVGIGNLINLEALGFEQNLLTGTIPSSIGTLNKLQQMVLSTNELSGTIPSSLGNLTSLGMLDLFSNKLQGSIPHSLGECRNLLKLDLSQNNLSGPIPKLVIGLASLSQALDLSRNQFSGSIPMEVGNLVNLISLNISENKLSGEIPQSLGSCICLTSLYLEGNSLQGTIPESLTSLRGIDTFNLSRNNLSGRIPKYLESFHLLQNLNLSFNDFEGVVPMQGVFTNTTAFSILGNTRLCGGIPRLGLPICISKQSKHGMSPRLKMIIIITCGVSGLISIFFLILLYRWRKARVLKSTSQSSFRVSLLKLSYGDLLKATDEFSYSNLIGVGSFGSVYRGVLHQQEERVIAVKVLNLQISRASKSFLAECEALRSIRHRNLVKLLTACSSVDFQGKDFKALIYEFMMNGSLDEWLHISPQMVEKPTNMHKHLNLIQRVYIAIDVASALEYLHNHCDMRIVHCDLKPSNVLLDGDMTARVGDFGLARCLPDEFCPVSLQESSSSAIKGSIGYTAPEYGMGSKVSTYGDVYSYGVLLLEMFTGKRPTDDMFKDGMNLHKFVLMALPERVGEICDPLLLQKTHGSSSTDPKNNKDHVQNYERQRVDKECLISIAKVGVACSAYLPGERMEISNVRAELCRIRDVLNGIRRPSQHI